MQFFLYEILARIVGIYVCYDCSRTLWSGLVERKITCFIGSGDIVDWLLTSPVRWTFERDAAPVRYWMSVGLQIFYLIAGIVMAIFGWFHPNS
ncbi:hypothetical protein [Bradyrhizobium sp.]|uniref:hypothetical protein n=1 Tax=Bradyrhizobium sp. TaxID=376 RepID=UPI002D3314E9|nr:hypothetical protein [Bradyrhizobium sp.]HZR72612.1 hypothetical protein [Bradyrhizobium sp.]